MPGNAGKDDVGLPGFAPSVPGPQDLGGPAVAAEILLPARPCRGSARAP